MESFGQVVLRGERLHEVAIAALAQGGKADEPQAGPDGTCQFGPSYAQPGCRVALQGTEAKDGQLVTDLVDPRGVLAGEEAALGDEQGDQDGSPGSTQSCWATADSAR